MFDEFHAFLLLMAIVRSLKNKYDMILFYLKLTLKELYQE